MPRILVLYNEPVLPPDHPDAESERDVLMTVEAVSRSIAGAGMEVVRLGVSRDPAALVAGLQAHRPDAVFNLFEGTGDQADNEAYVAGILEWFGVPFTGCPQQTLCVARNKHLTKHLFQGAGLPTSPFFVVDRLPVPEHDLCWPRIVKPAMQDGSVGLDQGSVVTEQAKLQERVALLLDRYRQPVLVEEFILGRELNVSLIEAPGAAGVADFRGLLRRCRPDLLADSHIRCQMEARLAGLRGDAAAIPGQGQPEAGEATWGAGRLGISLAGLPRLRPRRFPGPAFGQAVLAGGEPEPGL